MAILYTSKELQEILRGLRIKPKAGMVTTKEAAAILTWRAEHEQEIKHHYPESAVRRHVELGNLEIAGKKNKVANLFKFEDVFEVPLAPRRGIAVNVIPPRISLRQKPQNAE